jgi:3-methyladenine DNA glycosylase AlkD
VALFYFFYYSDGMYNQIVKELNKLANPTKAKNLQWFFKTGKGEYGEGDKFLGIVVPKLRMIAEKYSPSITLVDIKKLLQSPWHEYRLLALLILTYQFPLVSKERQKQIYNFYLKNTDRINNWDLVDLSAYKITGPYLFAKPDKKILYKLVKSKNVWERRIAVLTTFYFIRQNEFKDSLRLTNLLLNDTHDLMHKAVGWMLREIGKREQKVLEQFLQKHYSKMPRTMLRYAIERLSEKKKKYYMHRD